MANAQKKIKIFTLKKRQLRRRHIPRTEIIIGCAVIAFLVCVGLWVRAQKDHFNPGDRDLSLDALANENDETTLYKKPLEQWREPTANNATTTHADRQFDLGFFPVEILDNGWTASGSVRTFDPITLYEKINGSAPQYLERGFRKLHFLNLENASSGLELAVYAYDQGSLPNALDIFSTQKDKDVQVSKTGGMLDYPTSNGAIAILGPYYIKLEGHKIDPQNTAKAREILVALAAHHGKKEQAFPLLFQLFHEALQIPLQDISYQKNNVFQYDFAHDFWFAEFDTATEAAFFVHQAADADAAQKLFEQIISEESREHEKVADTQTGVLLEHRFLHTFLSINTSDQLVYGLVNIAAQEEAAPALEKLLRALAAFGTSNATEENF